VQVLVIDDDPEFRALAAVALDDADIEYVAAEDAEEGLRILKQSGQGRFDLILLDVQMPGASGWDLLLALRDDGNEIPVIFLTGLEKVEERVKGLRLGADDYVPKPVEFDELVARMEAVLRRRQSLSPIEFGDIHVDMARRKVVRAGNRIDLSPREYDLVLALIRSNGALMSREELLREVWDMDFDPGTNVLDVHIGRVRKKLDRHGRPSIETVRGQGYRMKRHEPVAP